LRNVVQVKENKMLKSHSGKEVHGRDAASDTQRGYGPEESRCGDEMVAGRNERS
jgi:hypothetical protein